MNSEVRKNGLSLKKRTVKNFSKTGIANKERTTTPTTPTLTFTSRVMF